jgi:hypothetical protein
MNPRLTYANATSTIALIVAIGTGGAYAATKLPDSSVGEFQLRSGAVTAQKIRKNAITAPKIKAEAVKQGKIAGGSITARKMTGSSVSTSSLQEGAVTNPKLANDSVSGDKVQESTLSQVPSAARADFATEAQTANPPAFARVTKEATTDPAQSKGIAQVKAGSLAGIYCVSASGFNPAGAQITPYFEGGGQISAFAKVGGDGRLPRPRGRGADLRWSIEGQRGLLCCALPVGASV